MRLGKLFAATACVALFAGDLISTNIPRKSPEHAITSVDGRQLLVSQQRGKVVALMFLLTTCPHCQQVTQVLNKLQTEYGPKGFQALGAALDDSPQVMLPNFLKRFQPTFPVGYSNRDAAVDYLQHPITQRMVMPQLVLIDRQGQIRAHYTGSDPFLGADMEKNLRSMIEGLLQDKRASRKK